MNNSEKDDKNPEGLGISNELHDPSGKWLDIKEESVEYSTQADDACEYKFSPLLLVAPKQESDDGSIPHSLSKTSDCEWTNFKHYLDGQIKREDTEDNISCDTTGMHQLTSLLPSMEQVFMEDLNSEGEQTTCKDAKRRISSHHYASRVHNTTFLPDTPSTSRMWESSPGMDFDFSDFSDSDDDDEWMPPSSTLKVPQIPETDSSSEDDEDMQQESAPASEGNRRTYFRHDPKFSPQQLAEPKTAIVGEQLRPIDYFKGYIDDQMIEEMTQATNQRYLAEHGMSLGVTKEEMVVFLGINFVMSVIGMPRQRMYWERYTQLNVVSNNMARDRFFKIRSNLKVIDDNSVTVAARKSDKLWKVRPLLNRVRQRCLKLPRSTKVSVDELIIPFRGRCSMRQHIPNKPTPDGLKCFALATPEGTVLDFEIFVNKEVLLDILDNYGVLPEKKIGTGEAVILQFVKSVDKGTRMYFDKYFTSPFLLEELQKHDLHGTGIIKKTVLPKAARFKTDKEMAKLGRGASYNQVRSDNAYAVTQWQDKKVVYFASTLHSIEPKDRCKKWSKKNNSNIVISRPSVVKEYNAAIGGVDIHDQFISYYRTSAKTKKWTVRVILHFFDLAAVNSWMEYRRDGARSKGNYLDFKMTLALQLIHGAFWLREQSGNSSFIKTESNSIDCSSGSTYELSETPIRKRQKIQPLPCPEERIHESKHLPVVLPVKTNFKRCRNPGCSGRTKVMCSSCDVYLCLTTTRNCFVAFHTR